MGKKSKSENVQVVVRVRPKNAREIREEGKDVVMLDHSTNSVSVDEGSGTMRTFAFDGCYDNKFSQRQIFNDSILPVVETVINGYNSTIFAYGQSGTGKTHTISGDLNDPDQYGVIPLSLEYIFNYIKEQQSPNLEFGVNVSFVEIYLGKCRDLLVDHGPNSDGAHNLELRENAQKLFYVQGLSSRVIDSIAAGMRLMDEGLGRREVKSTKLNNTSSRSHAVFSMNIRRHDKVADTRTEAKLLLVDLAGSERQSKTEAEGTALAEGSAINSSLTALGTVIDCLVKAKGHIPYRSSPLTMLLKDGLGGGSRTLIFGTLSPSSTNVQETISTLRFVDRAKQIKNKPRIQMDPKDAKIFELTEELLELKKRFGLITETGEEVDGGDGADGADGGGGGAADGDDAGKKRYAKSFEGEIEALKTRVEELEVQLTEKAQIAERASQELSTIEGRFQRERDEFHRLVKEAKEETAKIVEMQQLNESAAGGTVQEQLNELQRLCTNFVTTLDPDGTIVTNSKSGGGTPLKKGDVASLEMLASAFNVIESHFVVPTGGGNGSSPRRSSSSVTLPNAENSPPSGGLLRKRSFGGRSALSPAGQQAPSPPSAKPGASSSSSPASLTTTTTAGSAILSEATAVDNGKLPDDVLNDLVKKMASLASSGNSSSGGSSNEKSIKDALDDLLLRQRLAVHRSMFDVLKRDEGNNGNKKSSKGGGAGAPDDALERSVLAAYDHANDEIERLTDAVVKQKQLAQKAKEIADKRADEAAALKTQIALMKEDASKKHVQHAAEMERVQSHLIDGHNKKLEKVIHGHEKALKNERKQRDALQAKIDTAERDRADALQKYDVLVMQHEQLMELFETQKVETQRLVISRQSASSSALGCDDSLCATKERDSKNLQKLRTDAQRANQMIAHQQQQQQYGSASSNSSPLTTPRMPGTTASSGFGMLPPLGGALPPLSGPGPKRF